MPTVEQAGRHARQLLVQHYPEGEAEAILDRLLCDKYGLERTRRIVQSGEEFKHESELENDLNALIRHVPVQHITGFEYFHGLKIRVGPQVLIPRPETAELIDWILSANRKWDAVKDVCTGSGCIALAMRKYFPQARIEGSDISADALKLAAQSEADAFGSPAVHWVQQDVLSMDVLTDFTGLVISNPPYVLPAEESAIETNVLRFEPHQALYAPGKDALIFYKRIIELYPNAEAFFFELNPLTAGDLKLWCLERQLIWTERNDEAGRRRFASIRSISEAVL